MKYQSLKLLNYSVQFKTLFGFPLLAIGLTPFLIHIDSPTPPFSNSTPPLLLCFDVQLSGSFIKTDLKMLNQVINQNLSSAGIIFLQISHLRIIYEHCVQFVKGPPETHFLQSSETSDVIRQSSADSVTYIRTRKYRFSASQLNCED